MPPPPSRLARFLLAVAAGSLALAAVATWGWLSARRGGRVDLEALSPEDRQALLSAAFHANPGAFEPAWFDPPVGYTLRPGQTITAWADTFTANALGYRTGPPEKAPGTFRVVFVGDSWTFGMGIREAESFPRRFAELAAGLGAGKKAGRRVEAWTLALPGYNTLNELAALELFYPRLQPDAVVLCPCSNDMDSGNAVLPNGSLARSQASGDEFGDDHSLVFREHLVDSYTFRRRWGLCFRAIRDAEQRLAARRVPLFLYFTASWDEPFAHRLVAQSGLAAPYVITPRPFTVGRWRNPPPFRHGTPAANRLYGRMVYRLVAESLGWPAPPPATDGSEVSVHRRPPPGDWARASDELMAARTAEAVPEGYAPGPDREDQCVGPIDCATGLVGRATTVLVRRRAGASRLVLSLRRLAEAPSLYPLAVALWVPAPGGESRRTVTLAAGGPETQRFELAMPEGVAVGAALDVNLRAERVAVAPAGLAARSLYLAGIEQE